MRPVLLGLVSSLVLVLALGACSDDPKKRPIGATCTDSEQCASGLCAESKCLDPDGDEDEDTLSNRLEVGLGTNPLAPDSDGDGTPDRDELDDALAHRDSDGDGTPDALESALLDQDQDCVVDQDDPHDDDPVEGRTHPAVTTACPAAGVCGAAGAVRAVRCPDGATATPVCDFGGVPGYATSDADCDGVDENCDGTADEGGTCTTYPVWCDEITPRVDGTYTVDPDGSGEVAPLEVTCLFSIERGDWVRLTPAVSAVIAELAPEVPREYLLRKGALWYRSPFNLVPWRWTDGAPVAGLWYYQGVDGLGGFDCEHTEALPAIGVGCMIGNDAPALEVTSGVEATGTVTVCTEAWDVWPNGCEEGVELWVRVSDCAPDEGQLLADGGFADLEDGVRRCWFRMGEGQSGRYFSFESDVRPGGDSPSLRADNPSLETEIYEVEVGQTALPIIAGRGYVWGFWAKAAEPRTIRPFLQSRDLEVHLFNEDITLSTSWTYYQRHFIAGGSTFDGMLSYQLGQVSTAAVWLDDVSLVDVGPGPCLPTEDRILADGDFLLPALFCWEVFSYNQVTTTATYDASEIAPGSAGPSLRVTFSQGTETPSDSGIIQRNLTIPEGRSLRLAFWLKASAPTAVGYGLGDGQGYPGGFVTDVGTTWSQYTFDFVSNAGTAGTGSLQFQFGRPTVLTVWIDRIEIIDLGSQPDPR